MSFDYEKWESELREKVETHEFAFDPAAWDAMDDLLDQAAGAAAPKDNTPPPESSSSIGWIIGGAVIAAIAIAIAFLLQPTKNETVKLSSYSDQVLINFF